MARRKTEVFSMSFLDCITCAFGSVVLVYTLINAQGGLRAQTVDQAQRAEVSKLEEQVLEGYQKLVVLRNSLIETEKESVRTEGMGTRVLEETERLKIELADSSKETLSRREAIERLKADLKSLEEGNRRLEGASKDPSATGTRVRGFVGQEATHRRIHALFNGKLIAANSLQRMIQDRSGIDTFHFAGQVYYGHTGGVDGFGAWLAYLPEEKLAFAYATNGKVYPVGNIMKGIADIYWRRPFTVPSFEAFAISPEVLDKYVGVYGISGAPVKFTITRSGATLYAQPPGQPSPSRWKRRRKTNSA